MNGGARGGGPRGGCASDGPTLLYLARADLESLDIEPYDVVDTVEAGLRARGEGRAAMPPKLSLHGEGGAFAQAMAAWIPPEADAATAHQAAAGAATDPEVGLGVKWVTIFPDNVAAGLPAVNGLIVVSDPATGLPAAVMDASLITAWRTGAGAAVAARHLARPDVACLGVLGCGAQARGSVRAMAAVLPALRGVRCHDVVPAAAAAFVEELRAELPEVTFTVCAEAAQVTAGAGVVVTAITMSDELRPPLGAGLLEPGALAVALDYDAAWSGAAMAECDRFFCDDTAQTLATRAAGVRLAGIPGEIAGDLGELAAGRVLGRRRDDERLFCLNLGMAVEDVVTAELVLARARELGVGRELPL